MQKKTLTLPAREPFSFTECLWFIDRGYDDCLVHIRQGRIRKAFILDGEKLILDVWGDDKGLKAMIAGEQVKSKSVSYIEQYLMRWFDLEIDLKEYYQALSSNSKLDYMTKAFYGLRLIGIPDLFEAIVWCIIGQQINLSFAYRIKRRLVEQYGGRVSYEGSLYYTFPSPDDLLNVNCDDLLSMQLSRSKANAIMELSRAFLQGKISEALLAELTDFESQRNVLMSVKGVGTWTANYVLMKSLKVRDSIPYGDAGLVNALMKHKVIQDKRDLAGTKQLFKTFKGWESYLVFYLWRSLSDKKN